jgi:hypothetical protein
MESRADLPDGQIAVENLGRIVGNIRVVVDGCQSHRRE